MSKLRLKVKSKNQSKVISGDSREEGMRNNKEGKCNEHFSS